jgi:hypothetical protein
MSLIALMLLSGADGIAFSPFIVPVAGCIMILGIVLGGIWSGIRTREMQSQERLAAIARGVPIPPTPAELAIMHGKSNTDAKRRRDNIRLTATILLYGSAGIFLFFVVLSMVLQVKPVLCAAAAALIPAGLGLAFWVDARRQTAELAEAQSTSAAHLE